MADESYDDLDDQFTDWIAEAKANGQDPGSLTQMRSRLRRAIKDAKTAEQTGYERARTEIQGEGQRRQAFDRLAIPPALEGLFAGIELTDPAALDAKAAELKAAGIQWQAPGAPPPEGQQPLDRTAEQVAQMAAATTGGQVPVPSGDLEALALKAKTDPGSVDADAFAVEVNKLINAAGAGPGAGTG